MDCKSCSEDVGRAESNVYSTLLTVMLRDEYRMVLYEMTVLRHPFRTIFRTTRDRPHSLLDALDIKLPSQFISSRLPSGLKSAVSIFSRREAHKYRYKTIVTTTTMMKVNQLLCLEASDSLRRGLRSGSHSLFICAAASASMRSTQ
jgi:hypothetical protein